MTYAQKRVNGQWVDLTVEEIAARDAEAEAWRTEQQAQTDRQAKVEWAVGYLQSQNFRNMIDAVNASVELSTAQKTLYTRLIKGQAAISLLLRELANDIDITDW